MINWSSNEHKAALVRLAYNGKLAKSRAIESLINTLLADGWVIQSPRIRDVELVDFGRTWLLQILDARWPEWRAVADRLSGEGAPITASAIVEQRKARSFAAGISPVLPRVLNRKTFSAIFKTDSKRLGNDDTARPNVVLTSDIGLLLRTHAGAHLHVDGKVLDCDAVMTIMGVVFVPDRALLRAWRLAGALPSAIVTIENPATFYDLDLPPDVLAVLAPGWNTTSAIAFLSRLPDSIPLAHFGAVDSAAIPLAHFGDFDPAGLSIYRHLRNTLARPIHLVVPDFASEYVELHALPLRKKNKRWEDVTAEPDEPDLIRHLRARNQWLEQESLTLDARMRQTISEIGKRPRCTRHR